MVQSGERRMSTPTAAAVLHLVCASLGTNVPQIVPLHVNTCVHAL